MATLHLTGNTTVAALKKEFNAEFGSQIRVYNGRSQAKPEDKLSDLGLTNNGDFECRSSLTVASFIERMQKEFGLKVKVYTCDEWVAVLDGLTLESSGKVKKNAVKADMESMIAYKREDTAGVQNIDVSGEYTIDGMDYEVENNEASAYPLDGNMEEIVIPDTITVKGVVIPVTYTEFNAKGARLLEFGKNVKYADGGNFETLKTVIVHSPKGYLDCDELKFFKGTIQYQS